MKTIKRFLAFKVPDNKAYEKRRYSEDFHVMEAWRTKYRRLGAFMSTGALLILAGGLQYHAWWVIRYDVQKNASPAEQWYAPAWSGLWDMCFSVPNNITGTVPDMNIVSSPTPRVTTTTSAAVPVFPRNIVPQYPEAPQWNDNSVYDQNRRWDNSDTNKKQWDVSSNSNKNKWDTYSDSQRNNYGIDSSSQNNRWISNREEPQRNRWASQVDVYETGIDYGRMQYPSHALSSSIWMTEKDTREFMITWKLNKDTCHFNVISWQKGVIGLLIFSVLFGALGVVLAVRALCVSALARKIYYYHSAGEIFFVSAMGTAAALVLYPISVESHLHSTPHRYGWAYFLSWVSCLLFFMSTFCMMMDEVVRDMARPVTCVGILQLPCCCCCPGPTSPAHSRTSRGGGGGVYAMPEVGLGGIVGGNGGPLRMTVEAV